MKNPCHTHYTRNDSSTLTCVIQKFLWTWLEALHLLLKLTGLNLFMQASRSVVRHKIVWEFNFLEKTNSILDIRSFCYFFNEKKSAPFTMARKILPCLIAWKSEYNMLSNWRELSFGTASNLKYWKISLQKSLENRMGHSVILWMDHSEYRWNRWHPPSPTVGPALSRIWGGGGIKKTYSDLLPSVKGPSVISLSSLLKLVLPGCSVMLPPTDQTREKKKMPSIHR